MYYADLVWLGKQDRKEKYWKKQSKGKGEERHSLAWCNIKWASEMDGQDPVYHMYFSLIITTRLISSHRVQARYTVLRLNID